MDRRVFISYSHSDKEWANWIGSRLAKRGFRIWTDENAIAAGESFISELTRTIEQADAVVAVVSPRYLRSKWGQYEVAAAAVRGVPVIPVLVERVEPEETKGVLPFLQWADLTADRDRGMRAVIQAAEELPALSAA